MFGFLFLVVRIRSYTLPRPLCGLDMLLVSFSLQNRAPCSIYTVPQLYLLILTLILCAFCISIVYYMYVCLQDRSSILHIHTQHWDPPLRHSFLSELAEHTVGYCGADLRALCTEAALFSLRRQYPQIYATSDKLVIDPTKINISAADFYSALKSIVPTTQRTDSPQAHSLCDNVFPLLGEQFLSLLSYCAFIFPQSWNSVCRSQQEIRSRLGREKEKEIERTSMRHCGSSEMSYIRPAQSIPLSCNKHTQEAASSLSSTTYMCTADMNCRQVGTTRSSNSSVLPYHAAQQSLPLRDIFFDSSHVLSDCGSMDILVRGSASSADHVTSGFLTLSSNPHMPPLPHRPRLLLAGQKGMIICCQLNFLSDNEVNRCAYGKC